MLNDGLRAITDPSSWDVDSKYRNGERRVGAHSTDKCALDGIGVGGIQPGMKDVLAGKPHRKDANYTTGPSVEKVRLACLHLASNGKQGTRARREPNPTAKPEGALPAAIRYVVRENSACDVQLQKQKNIYGYIFIYVYRLVHIHMQTLVPITIKEEMQSTIHPTSCTCVLVMFNV